MENKLQDRLTDEERKILSQALWDLNLTPEEFLEIIEGKSKREWPERGFCVARMLESINWFDVVKIMNPREVCRLWGEAKQFVRLKSIKEGMDFACRILR
ncbi:MAG: hypothetical protein PH343_04395 [Nitrospira sp.]|nr:hypothetical protein [Nitrospira sp.]